MTFIMNENLISLANKHQGSLNERHFVFNFDGLSAFADEIIQCYIEHNESTAVNEDYTKAFESMVPLDWFDSLTIRGAE